MIEVINDLLGVHMWVHESRVDEYLAAGHRLAAEDVEEKPAEKPRRKRATTDKKRG